LVLILLAGTDRSAVVCSLACLLFSNDGTRPFCVGVPKIKGLSLVAIFSFVDHSQSWIYPGVYFGRNEQRKKKKEINNCSPKPQKREPISSALALLCARWWRSERVQVGCPERGRVLLSREGFISDERDCQWCVRCCTVVPGA
jgi:hypothetical protein